jgi:hypothetical protein
MKKILLAFTMFAVFLSACKKEEASPKPTGYGPLKVYFEHIFGASTFNLKQNYITVNNDTMNFSLFNYYVSNFEFIKSDGSVYTYPVDSSYFLIKESIDTSRTIIFNNIPAGEYVGVKFIIGVDSLRNTMPLTSRTGVLDPATGAAGMYWSWNTGYIFLKSEGTCSAAPTAMGMNNLFQHHIGLYGGLNTPTINNVKKLNLAFPGTLTAIVGQGLAPWVHYKVDISKMYADLDFERYAVVMANPYSATIANNYATIFAIEHVHNEK